MGGKEVAVPSMDWYGNSDSAHIIELNRFADHVRSDFYVAVFSSIHPRTRIRVPVSAWPVRSGDRLC